MGGKASGEGGEMKRPEKKDLIIKMGVSKKEAKEVHDKYCFTCGYNQACGEWKEFLPDEDEIFEILDNANDYDTTLRDYAKAISARLHGG